MYYFISCRRKSLPLKAQESVEISVQDKAWEWGIGNGALGMGHWEWGIGNGACDDNSQLTTVNCQPLVTS
ncbi:hypothetical protein QUA56_00305 [Microcoleus sp. N3A4]|uniref:hypothetical protein n=1 Tax=Microcoleus sp. N3A4 TaxID=3055379 RepID=UPI002FD6DF88